MDNGQANAALKQTEGLAIGSAKSIGSSMRSIGQSATSAGGALSLLALPLTIFAAGALDASAKFEEAMNRVKAISQDSSDDIGRDMSLLSDLAREMGASTRYSATEAAEALGYLAQAGFSVEEMMGSLPGVLNMAAAEGMGLAQAADIASGILRGFSIEADQMTMVADVLAKTSAATWAGCCFR